MGKAIKVTAIVVAAVISALILAVAGYLLYVIIQYYRIEDGQELEIVSAASEDLVVGGREYDIVTYNIGFGAYSPQFSFFMDSGVMDDGTEVAGKYGRAISRDEVVANVTGAASVLAALDADFCFVQEVDLDGYRSRHVDQLAILRQALEGDSTYAINFHSANLLYPFSDPHGKNTSGIATFSKVKINDAVRRQYPVDGGVAKFFDLDRCFVVHRVGVEGGGELVLINSHMSAYDEGGAIRAKQLQMLNDFIDQEYKKGNYVIVGGDFNHELADSFGAFATKQQQPTWAYPLTDADLGEHFSVVATKEGTGTCRSAEIPYVKGVNYLTVLDGFVVSDNIKVKAVINVDTDFAYSDHNPVKMTFELLPRV